MDSTSLLLSMMSLAFSLGLLLFALSAASCKDEPITMKVHVKYKLSGLSRNVMKVNIVLCHECSLSIKYTHTRTNT